ncbi:MAG: glycosyltransferase family 2 protein [Planctomycetaceae bacterium]|nr:glycosyltransferase family 2 protein [Planctomycetaceae bacterium]
MLSIIVPVLNEALSLQILAGEIRQACDDAHLDYELIFVDDGSQDDSWKTISQLSETNSHIRGIRFRRNFGKAAALSAGIEVSQGDILFCLDADLQDDPAEIPRFLERLNQGMDVVNGWKERRLDPWHKVYPSKVFNWMVSTLTGLSLHDHNCGFKCFRREVAKELRLYGELHRFIPVLAHSRGFKVSEITVHHRRREFGHSKYGFNRFIKGFLDLLTVKFLTGYGQRPQHLLGAVGLTCFGLGLLGMIYLALVWTLNNAVGPLLSLITGHAWFTGNPIGNRPLLSYSVAGVLLGAQLLSLGLLAELIVSRIAGTDETYSIAEQVGETDK